MAVARQSVGAANASGATSSLSVSWSKTTTAGSLLLLAVAVNGGTDVNIHVPAGWTAVGSQIDRLTSVTLNLYYKANAAAASGSVTANFVLRSDDSTTTTRFAEIYLAEYTGMAISSVVDQTKNATGSSTTIDTGATTTTGANNEIAFCLAACANAPSSVDFNANTTSYTELVHKYSPSNGTDRLTSSVYEKSIASSGTQFQFTTTLTGGVSRAWCVLAVTLKTVSTTPVTPTVPPAQGLFRAGATSLQSDRLPPVMNGITVYPDWSQLEASNTGALNGSAVAMIDNAVTYCNSNSILLKIRLFANGNNAAGGASSCPAWLSTLCGTFKHANSQAPTAPETMTIFWVQQFLDHYDRLMSLMSARWDSNACLVDVTISNAMMKYAEPLIRDLNIKENRAELVGGGPGFSGATVPGVGYSDALNVAAIKAGMDTHASYWPNTCSSFAYNPFQSITSYSTFSPSEAAPMPTTKSLMDYHRQVLGPRGVIENNSLRDSYFTYDGTGAASGIATPGSGYGLMYTYMTQAGPPLFFQTATRNPINRIGDFKKTMDGIVNVLGGNAVEPPTDYETDATAATSDASEYNVANFTTWNAALIANPTGAGTTTTVTKSSSDTGTGADSGTITVTTPTVTTVTSSDTGTGSDASVIAAPLPVITNPTGHKPAKRS